MSTSPRNTAGALTAEGQEAMKLLVMGDRNLLIETVKNSDIAEFEALASLVAD